MSRCDVARPHGFVVLLVVAIAAAGMAGAGCRSTSGTTNRPAADSGMRELESSSGRRAERAVRPEETVTFDEAVARIGDAMLASPAASGGSRVGVLTVLFEDAARPEEQATREDLRRALNKRYLGRARFVESRGLGDVEPDELATVVDLRASVTLPELSRSAVETWVRVRFEPLGTDDAAREVSVLIAAEHAADAAPLSRRN